MPLNPVGCGHRLLFVEADRLLNRYGVPSSAQSRFVLPSLWPATALSCAAERCLNKTRWSRQQSGVSSREKGAGLVGREPSFPPTTSAQTRVAIGGHVY